MMQESFREGNISSGNFRYFNITLKIKRLEKDVFLSAFANGKNQEFEYLMRFVFIKFCVIF